MRKTSFGPFPSRALSLCVACLAWLLSGGAVADAQTATASISAGSHPYAVAVNMVTNKIYVANFGSNDVTAIDGTSNAAVQIPVGMNPASIAMTQPTAIAVNPATNRIYVVNQGTAAKQYTDGGVAVIDGSTNLVVAGIAVGKNPVALGVNPLTNKIYVANYGAGLSTVSVINGATNAVTTTANVGVSPTAVAINTATDQVYVANKGSNTISVIDGASDAVTATISVSPAVSPIAVAVNPALNHVYVATSFSSPVINPSVSVIDPVGKKVLKTVTVGNNPTGLAANSVTNMIYVANQNDGTVTVIQDGANIGSNVLVPAGNHPFAVAVNQATNQVYVTNQGGNSLTVIDGSTNIATAAVAVGTAPNAAAVNPVTNKIYIANTGNDVTVVDGATNATAVDIAGTQPIAVAVNPVTNHVYVANRGNSTVTVIDEVTSSTSTVPVGVQPSAIAVNPVTNKVYVANYGSYSVSSIDGATNVATVIRGGPHPIAVAVNPVTNMIYVANQGTALKTFLDSSVTVIDGATNTAKNVPFGEDTFFGGSLQLVSIAVDPVFNQIYVVNEGTAAAAYTDGLLYMLSGMDNATITAFFPAGTISPIQPIAVTVNPLDGHVFMADFGSSDVNVFDPFGDYLADIVTGTHPYAMALNPATNYVYTANYDSHNVTAISDNIDPNFGTYLFPTTSVNVGSNPYALAASPVTNKIYVADNSSNSLTVIDGVSGATSTVSTRTKPTGLDVNPTTGKIYVANNGSNNVTVVTEVPTSNPTVPLTIQVAGVVDSGTSPGPVFATSNPSPAFTATVTSSFSPNVPVPTALYYQLDSTLGAWQTATETSGGGSNPANYQLTLGGALPGSHNLYFYAAYGAEGAPRSAGNGTGNSPELSALQVYPFAIVNPPTSTTLSANINPLNAGDTVTFSTCALPFAGTGSFLGTMTLFDGSTVLGQKVIDPNDPNGVNPCPTFATNRLTAGAHTITAVYSGSTALSASRTSMMEQVDLGLELLVSLPTNGMPVYGQNVKIAARVALAGAVTFSVNGTPQPPVNVVGGQASITLTRPAAGAYNITASFAGTAGANLVAPPLAVTVNPAPLTINPISTFRFYGVANPALHGTVLGVLTGDGITASFTVPGLAFDSPVGDYPITVTLNDPNNKLSNYAVTINPGTLSVFTAPLTVIALSEARAYGTPDNFKGILVGAIAEDKAGFVITGTTSVAIDSPAGSYKNAITPHIIDNNNPPKLGNYYIANSINGTLTITKALLTVAADSKSRSYGAADPTFTTTITGALASDGLTGFGTSTDTAGSIVSTYLITPHVNDPNNRLSNYILISRVGFLTVTKAPLTVTADNQARSVGQPNPTLTGEIVGAVPADNLTATYTTTATMASPAGMYPIVPMLNANPKLSNYTVTLVNGVLTVQ